MSAPSCEETRLGLCARLDGEALPAPEAQAIAEHLEGCPDCAAEEGALELAQRAVRELPRIAAPPHFTAQVMARVLDQGEAAPAHAACPAPEQVSALVDGALDPPPAAALREHLAVCPACAELERGLARVAGAVRGLPRLNAPPAFATGVLARCQLVDREGQERAEAARRARAALWSNLGRLAQAASLLLVLGAGAALSSPGPRGLRWLPSPSRAQARRAPARAPAADEARAEGPRLEELAPGPYDATWELDLDGAVEEVAERARAVLGRHARRVLAEAQAAGDGRGFVAVVPANRVDDLLRELDADAALEPRPQAWAAMEQIHAEQDRVHLDNGFVLVGALEGPARARTLRVGPSTLPLDEGDVERVEQAEAARKVRLLLRRKGGGGRP